MDIADSNRSDIPSISSALPGGARRTIIRFGLLVLAVTAPTGNATIGLAVLLVALPLVLRDIRWGEPAASGRLEAPVIAFIGACLVSSVLGFNVWVGMGHVVGLSIMAAVGLIGGRLAVQDRRFFFTYVMPAFLISTMVSSGIALYQYFVLDVARASALLSYVNRLATLLVFFGTLGAGYLLHLGRKHSWWLLPYGVVALAGTSSTLSRAGWVSAIVAMVLMTLRGGRRFSWAFAAVMLLGVLLLSVDPNWLARFQTITIEHNQDRIALWSAAFDMFKDHPIAGTGPGGFLELSSRYIETVRYQGHSTAHNLMLNIASDLGLIGLAAFGWLVSRLIAMGAFLWRHGTMFHVGLASAVAAIFVNDLFGHGFYTTQVGTVMWFGIGLLAAFYEDLKAKSLEARVVDNG